MALGSPESNAASSCCMTSLSYSLRSPQKLRIFCRRSFTCLHSRKKVSRADICHCSTCMTAPPGMQTPFWKIPIHAGAGLNGQHAVEVCLPCHVHRSAKCTAMSSAAWNRSGQAPKLLTPCPSAQVDQQHSTQHCMNAHRSTCLTHQCLFHAFCQQAGTTVGEYADICCICCSAKEAETQQGHMLNCPSRLQQLCCVGHSAHKPDVPTYLISSATS